jgi:hypothetical protein
LKEVQNNNEEKLEEVKEKKADDKGAQFSQVEDSSEDAEQAEEPETVIYANPGVNSLTEEQLQKFIEDGEIEQRRLDEEYRRREQTDER